MPTLGRSIGPSHGMAKLAIRVWRASFRHRWTRQRAALLSSLKTGVNLTAHAGSRALGILALGRYFPVFTIIAGGGNLMAS